MMLLIKLHNIYNFKKNLKNKKNNLLLKKRQYLSWYPEYNLYYGIVHTLKIIYDVDLTIKVSGTNIVLIGKNQNMDDTPTLSVHVYTQK